MNRARIEHPGVHLRDALTARGITPYRLAQACRIPQARIGDVLLGKRRITADTAVRIAVALGTSPEFWLYLQTAHDIQEARAALDASTITVLPLAV